MDELPRDRGGSWVHVLETSPREGPRRRPPLEEEALFMEGSLCPRLPAENFTQIMSFRASDRHCHILIVQMKNLKVKEAK